MKDFTGRVAVVTGAASGIGCGLARAFAAAGMRVVLADVEAGPLERVRAELAQGGGAVTSLRTDVAQAGEVEALAAHAYATFGAVHVLCNNAGVITDHTPLWQTTAQDWDWVMGVNVMGVVHGIQAFLPRMIEQGATGHVVNTASVGGLVAGTANSIYIVSKHAVVALSECLYNELAREHPDIGVSVLCPGWVRTGIADADRNRAAAPAGTPAARRMRERFRHGLSGGLDADDVGTLVVDAIREPRFYILTHPHWNHLISERGAAILDGKIPAAARLPRT